MLTYLILGTTLAFAAAIQPGPFQTYIISQSLSKGWKSVLPAALGPLISDIPIFIVVMVILNTMPESMIHALQIGGGLLLFYFSYKTFVDLRKQAEQSIEKADSKKTTLLKAALVNFINPAPYLSWTLIMGPMFLEGWNQAPINGVVLVVGFYTILTLSQAGIIFVFGTARKLGPKITRTAAIISILGLLAFGMYELWLGLSYFINSPFL